MFVDFTTFEFTAHTIDGKILEFPQVITMRCDLVQPLYQQVVRQYDGNECILARKVYMVMYGGHLYGTTDFKTMTEFIAYRNSECQSSEEECCLLTYGGCYITFNGEYIKKSA